MTEPQWLRWSRQLMAVAQNGLTYASNPFDIDRYQSIRKIAAAIMADHTLADQQRIENLFAQEAGYATPKVDVRGVVFRDQALLLVKERQDGRWTLPGGWADVNESPSEAVVREVFEESGYRTRATKLLAVFDRAKHPHVPLLPFHIYKLFLRCQWLGGEPTSSTETEAVGFFREDQLPELSHFPHHSRPSRPPLRAFAPARVTCGF